MKPNLHSLKHSVELPGGVTLAKTMTGEIVAIDREGVRRALDNADHVRWFYNSTADDFPKSPAIPPPSPETVAAAARARKSRESAKAGSPLTGHLDADGNMVIALEDGTTVTLPSA